MKRLDAWPHPRQAAPGTPGAPGRVTTLGWSQFVVVAVVIFAMLLLVGLVLWAW